MDIKDIKIGKKYLFWDKKYKKILSGKLIIYSCQHNHSGEYTTNIYPLDGSYWLCKRWRKCDNCNFIHKEPHIHINRCHSKGCLNYTSCIPITEENIPRLFGEEDKKKSYQERQDEWIRDHGLKKGDKVRVVRKAVNHESGWDTSWLDNMDKYIDKVVTIKQIDADGGIRLLYGMHSYYFPYFVLEPVKDDKLKEAANICKQIDFNNFTEDQQKELASQWLLAKINPILEPPVKGGFIPDPSYSIEQMQKSIDEIKERLDALGLNQNKIKDKLDKQIFIEIKKRMKMYLSLEEINSRLDALEGDKRYEGKVSAMQDKPKIIVLCGSTRYVDIFAVTAWILERDEGAIVMGLHLLPGWYSSEEIPDHLAEHEGVKEHFDNLHMRKIDLADEIFIINKDDYIGNSTKREIEYAQSKNIPLRWYTHDYIGKIVNNILNAAIRREERNDE